MKILCCSSPHELGFSRADMQSLLEQRLQRLIHTGKIIVSYEAVGVDSGFMEGDVSGLDSSLESCNFFLMDILCM